MKPEAADALGQNANEFAVKLSIHAPYYINLCSEDKQIVEASRKRIFDSALLGEHMGAHIIAIHPSYYGKLTPSETFQETKRQFEKVLDDMKSNGITHTKLGFETTGRVSQFGTIDETLEFCRQVDCLPYIDFAHIYARQGGRIDYSEILDKWRKLRQHHLHVHFAGINWTPVKGTSLGNEKNHLEIGVNKPPFEPLARELLQRKIDATIICESPALEQDCLIMKETFKKLGYKF